MVRDCYNQWSGLVLPRVIICFQSYVVKLMHMLVPTQIWAISHRHTCFPSLSAIRSPLMSECYRQKMLRRAARLNMNTDENQHGQLHTTQPQTHLRHSMLIKQDEWYITDITQSSTFIKHTGTANASTGVGKLRNEWQLWHTQKG